MPFQLKKLKPPLESVKGVTNDGWEMWEQLKLQDKQRFTQYNNLCTQVVHECHGT
jgi:hypothetical protein